MEIFVNPHQRNSEVMLDVRTPLLVSLPEEACDIGDAWVPRMPIATVVEIGAGASNACGSVAPSREHQGGGVS